MALILFTGIFCLMYFLPWVINPSMSLTFGAYDLAEWTSLHPEVRFSEPALLLTLALRIQPLLLVALITLHTPQKNSLTWWVAVLITLVTSAGLLPPVEFISNTTDSNYQQQFALSVTTFMIGFLGLSVDFKHFKPIIGFLTALGGIGTTAYALVGVQHYMIGFSMPVAIGIGGFGLILLYLAVIINNIKRGGSKF